MLLSRIKVCLLCRFSFDVKLNCAGVHHKLLEAFSLLPSENVSFLFFTVGDVGWCYGQEEDGPSYNSELVVLLLALLDTATASGWFSGQCLFRVTSISVQATVCG